MLTIIDDSLNQRERYRGGLLYANRTLIFGRIARFNFSHINIIYFSFQKRWAFLMVKSPMLGITPLELYEKASLTALTNFLFNSAQFCIFSMF